MNLRHCMLLKSDLYRDVVALLKYSKFLQQILKCGTKVTNNKCRFKVAHFIFSAVSITQYSVGKQIFVILEVDEMKYPFSNRGQEKKAQLLKDTSIDKVQLKICAKTACYITIHLEVFVATLFFSFCIPYFFSSKEMMTSQSFLICINKLCMYQSSYVDMASHRLELLE